MAAGKFADAERLARTDTEILLDPRRKDALADVYRGFAERLLKPDSPTTPSDPEGAHALLAQALNLAKGEATRAAIRLRMGHASQLAGNPGRAMADYQAYLNEFPKGPDRSTARFHLGESQLGSGQALPARLTWTDLAHDLEKVDTREAADFRARSFFGISRTYGLPNPPDDAQLGLGVAALRKLVAEYPGHDLAVQAGHEIGMAYLSRGKTQEALAAFAAFLQTEDARGASEEARRRRAELLMDAQYRVGLVLQSQGRYSEAITAYQAYLARYPNGPQSADAQRATLDSRLQIAYDLLRAEKYADARAAFLAFATQNPLDGRVPQALFEVGQAFAAEKKYDDAISAWETLAGKFPNTEPSGHALFAIAATFEEEKADPASAIERFRKVNVEPWQSQANQRVAVMEAKSLTVVTERAFRSGDVPKLKIATRNLPKLTFTAYKIDPEAYFRKKHAMTGVEAMDISLVAPDAEWTADVPDYGKYKPIDSQYELKKIEVPGVYVVKVSDEKNLQATTLVIGSDIDAIVKSSREQILVFAQDMKTGKGRKGARILVSDGSGVIFDGKTGDDGVLLKDWEKPRDPNSGITYLVLDGGDVAGSGLTLPGTVAQGLTARAYIYTDRPAYRPGQTVALRGVVREVEGGQYAILPDANYVVEIYDAKGRKLVDKPLKLSNFGTFHLDLPLETAAPIGTYRVRLTRPGKSEFSGAFEVQAYALRKIDLAMDLPRTVYYRGETVKGSAIAKYQYGTPLADRAIAVTLPDGRVLRGKTDAEGKFPFELETTGFAEERALRIVAQLPEDGVGVAANVMLAVRAFRIDLNTSRDVYLDGESFPVRISTIDAQGEPLGETLSVAVLKRTEKNGQTVEREVSREEIKTDPKTGAGSIRLKVEDKDGGAFVVRAAGTDRFKNPIVADLALTISGEKDATKLRLLTDRTSYKVGEGAEIRLINRGPAGTALVAWEADRILSYRLVPVKEGENPLAWEVAGNEFPNFTLSAAKMAPSDFQEARLDLRIERDLRVTIRPTKPAVGPGEEVEVEITTTDQNGKPTPAELSLALVDKSLLRLFQDKLPAIGSFFYNQSRTAAFTTESSATFRYSPETVPVPQAVVEEADRKAAMVEDLARLGEVRMRAGLEVAKSEPGPVGGFEPPAAMAAAPAPAPAGAEGKIPQAVGGGGLGGQNSAMFGGRRMADIKDAALGLQVEEMAEADFDGEKAGEAKKKAGTSYNRRDWAADRGVVARKSRGGAGGANGVAPRERFVETAFWDPAIVTGKDGRAVVKFRARAPCPNTSSPPEAPPAPTPWWARPRPRSPSARTFSSI